MSPDARFRGELLDVAVERVKAEKLGDVVAPRNFGLDPILAVHDRGFVTFLQTLRTIT